MKTGDYIKELEDKNHRLQKTIAKSLYNAAKAFLWGAIFGLAISIIIICSVLVGNEQLNKDNAGSYFSKSQRIEIYGKNVDRYYIFYVANHEIGHYYWYNELKQLPRRRYNTIFKESDIFVSEYAKTDIKEDFAETFATAISCEFNLNKIPNDRREFFQNHVAYRLPCKVIR